MPPRPPFTQAAVRESTIASGTPWTITLHEPTFNETWKLELDAQLGSQLTAYVRAQQALGQPIDRLQVTTILNS